MTDVLITGGSRGIGRATCEAFARQGARVAFFYRTRDDAAEETLEALRSLGAEDPCAEAVDVADATAVEAAFTRLAERGRTPEVLVNCAGITADRTLHKLCVDDWSRVIDTNLSGAFHCASAALGPMRESRFGRIINIASIIGQTGNVGQTNYAASKAGLIGFTKALALETARYDITVNAVCPGFIDTDMLGAVPEDARDAIIARIPKGRFGTPGEIARVVVFLAQPESSFITGAQMNINGGMHL